MLTVDTLARFELDGHGHVVRLNLDSRRLVFIVKINQRELRRSILELTQLAQPPSQPVPVLTEAWIYEDDVFKELTLYMKAIFGYMKRHNVSFPQPAQPVQPSQKWDKPNKSSRKRCSGNYWEEGEHTEPPQYSAPVVLVLEFRLSVMWGITLLTTRAKHFSGSNLLISLSCS